MPYTLVHTFGTTSTPVTSSDDKASCARAVRDALVSLDVPLAGLVWRPIAAGLMSAPVGETVLGTRGHNFTII